MYKRQNQLSLQMMAAVPALLAGFVAVVVVRRFFSYIRREPTHPRRRFTQLVREAERLLLEDLDDVDVGKGDGGGGADQLLTEEHLGCLCYLVQVLFMAFMASMRARARLGERVRRVGGGARTRV